MRARVLCAVFSVTAVLAVLIAPPAAQAEPDVPGGSATVRCSSPPDTDGATPENRDRFVDLWSARFADNGWRKAYVERKTVPADILAEGFHSLPEPSQLWLSACLLEDILATAAETPTARERETLLTGVALVVFGKQTTEDLREELNEPAPPPPADLPPVERDLTGEALDATAEDLAEAPSLTSARQPRSSAAAPTPRTSSNITAGAPGAFLDELTAVPAVPLVVDAVDALLQEVAKVEQTLFTLPVVNLLAPLFYRICAESSTMELSCSVSVPVGVPVPADVTGDNIPDVLAQLNPMTNLVDVGARFWVQRMNTKGDLPAHVFAVYDTPVVKKRVAVGIDGRASTLGWNSTARLTLKNIVKAITGDIEVAANVFTNHPGATEAITFGVKSLAGGSTGIPASEQDPLTGSIQMSPFPMDLDVGARMIHGSGRSQDTITVSTPTPTKVDAVIDQAVDSGTTDSNRRFTATVDELPTDVRIDLVRQGTRQNATYRASDEIGFVQATDTTTPDTSKPDEVDNAVYQVHGVPEEVGIDFNGNLITYDASDTIDKVYAGVERMGGDTITAEVRDVPDHAEVLFDGKNAVLDWDASAATTSATAAAHLTAETLDMDADRDFDAGLTITSIPAKWNASWGDGNVLFEAPEAGIGSITANVTNHEEFQTLPGDHLTGRYDEASGDLDASLRISNLRRAAFTKLPDTGNGGGFEAGLDMGDKGAFSFAGEIHTAEGDLEATGAFSNLPSEITLRSEGGHITYTGSTNPDLTLSVAAGRKAALDATPEPPPVHGVSVRDGAAGADKAIRAKLHLTGLPTGLDLNSTTGIYTVTGYHPTIDQLVVDAVLTALVPKPISLQLQQGVPTDEPVDFTFGPMRTGTAPDGSRTIGLDYVTSQPLGTLLANARYDDTDEAQLSISEIPETIEVDASFGADTKTINVGMIRGIDDITASYKHVGDADYAASVHLHDVPKTVDITIGKESASSGGTTVDAPVFTMTADSEGLDIDAFAAARIADPVDASAAVTLTVTNLGKTVTADLVDTRLHITSTPATDAFALEAAGRVQKTISLDWDGGVFQNTGSLSADLKIKSVTLGLTDFSDVNLRLGFTTGLDGTFGSFTFGQDTDLTIDLQDQFSVYIDWPDPLGSDTIPIVNIPHATIPFGNVAPRWHINQNVQARAFHFPIFHFGIADCGLSFDVRPAPGYTTPGNTFTLGQPTGDGTNTPAWLITPDINLLGFSLPDFGLDIIAYFLSPYGNNIHPYPECQWLV